MILRAPWTTTQYQVEVSGHDAQDCFFADVTTLEWSEETGKMFRSRRYLSPGSTVFLRMLSVHGRNGVPLPYRVGTVSVITSGGWMVWLAPHQQSDHTATDFIMSA